MRLPRFSACLAAALMAAVPAASPAYLFWTSPTLPTDQVVGTEPGIALPLPGATAAETRANLVWTLRTGLNFAALQCQFAPGLMAVRYYNDILRYHADELQSAQKSLQGYFRRTAKKTWLNSFDSFNTRVYNGFNSFHAQLGFCDAAAIIARDAMARPRGQLFRTAETRMRALRNAQSQAVGDAVFAISADRVPSAPLPTDLQCYAYDKRGRRIDCETGKRVKEPKA